MQINLKIGSLTIAYIYHYDTYLKDHLLAYELKNEDKPKYHLEVILSKHILRPSLEPLRIEKQKLYGYSQDLDYISRIVDEEIVEQIVFDKKNKNAFIYLNPSKNENLALREYMLSSLMFLEIANHEGYMSLHASAISFQNQALLFSAPSRTGKSTHATYWKLEYPNDVFFINDDKPLIYLENNQFYVTGSPFSGKALLNENKSRPLKAIFFLEQSGQEELIKLNPKESLPYFFKNMMRPKDEHVWNNLLKMMESLIVVTPVYLHKAIHHPDSAKYAHDILFGGLK